MSAGAFKNIFLSLNFTTKHTRQRLFALVIHVVMCCIAGALGKPHAGRMCVAPLAWLVQRSNIAHNYFYTLKYQGIMNSISITYALEWRLKSNHHYQVTKCGKMFNLKSGKLLKKTINNRCKGYWIGKKFYSLTFLRTQLEPIPKQTTPF